MQGEIAFIGLGRMGSNMARRLLRSKQDCFIFDIDSGKREALRREGAKPLQNLGDLKTLSKPRVAWLMLPAGEITEKTVQDLLGLLENGDILIDGGNSYFKDDVRRARLLAERGIRWLDVGVSGGVWGLERGYSLMVGGDRDAASTLEPIFRVLAPGENAAPQSQNRVREASTADKGYYYCGPAGAGHFVKMVHNGIEYGMMQALAEGFDLLRNADTQSLAPEFRYSLNLREISEVWRRGSVVSSWLLDLIADALNRDLDLSRFIGSVQDSGEGRWTVQAGIEEGVPLPVISNSLFVRFRSREERSFAEQLLSAMRNEFGGHAEAERKAS